jgi:hypothetical protein
MFKTKSAEEFQDLPPEENVLEDMPNHMLLHPRYLTAMTCPRSIEAKVLAATIIEDINRHATDNPNMSEDEALNPDSDKEDVEVLLAFLWASTRGTLKLLQLNDTPESPQLNHQCEALRQKVRGRVAAAPT